MKRTWVYPVTAPLTNWNVTRACKGVSRVSGFGVVDMRSRGFSARSSQINNVGSIDQALMQSMEQKGLMDHREKDITAWCEDLHEKCHVCCQAFLRSLMDLWFDGPQRERHHCMV
ncbi:hypothetical protein DY000_02016829 [Brassica cretica]|uniref:Uncharacterized protein n=1 Tax=Brassica cretica TaxID=69181 RepID=A0ABQ7CU31_BRACR|nr:hypothetical protein DY000_02016829 [Brassica cretica]